MTRIYLDSGNPDETKEVKTLLGSLTGQTTNPSLVAKNPEVQARIKEGKFFTKKEIYEKYKAIVQSISKEVKESVSIEVYADMHTPAEEMIEQARVMWQWIPNAHIKFPTIPEGLKAAEIAIKEGMRVNMTLVFTLEQAAAVHAATRGAKKGDVYLSPFIGRLDDKEVDGISLVQNICTLYKKNNSHVEVLAASERTIHHLMDSFKIDVDLITAPLSVIREWVELGKPYPSVKELDEHELKKIDYKDIDLSKSWQEYPFEHELITQGIDKFVADWNTLLGDNQ